MRLPRMTTRRWMIQVASSASCWGSSDGRRPCSSPAALTVRPLLRLGGHRGEVRRSDPARLAIDKRLNLFAWAWLFSTIRLFGVVCLVSMIQGIRLVSPVKPGSY